MNSGCSADLPGSTQYAEKRGMPQARNGVILAGIAFLLGGASVILGIWGDLGAMPLIVTLIPMTFLMHKFWAERDLKAKQIQFSMFMKNIALIGEAYRCVVPKTLLKLLEATD
jgi:putative oxidoreductase